MSIVSKTIIAVVAICATVLVLSYTRILSNSSGVDTPSIFPSKVDSNSDPDIGFLYANTPNALPLSNFHPNLSPEARACISSPGRPMHMGEKDIQRVSKFIAIQQDRWPLLHQQPLGTSSLSEEVKHLRYFEWGSGGSTSQIPFHTTDAYSAESDKAFCESLLSNQRISCLIHAGALTLYCPDLGPTVRWGGPSSADQYPVFTELYIKAIDTPIKNALGSSFSSDTITPFYSVVFVDGRFRVACALYALRFISKYSIVMIHDFQQSRPYRDAVLKYYDVVESSVDPIENVPNLGAGEGTLVVLKMRPGLTAEQRLTAYQDYVDKPN